MMKTFYLKRHFFLMITAVFLSLCLLFATAAISADHSDVIVPIPLPSGYVSPERLHLTPQEEGRFILTGTENQSGFAMLLDQSGAVLDTVTSQYPLNASFLRGGRLYLISPVKSGGSPTISGVRISTYTVSADGFSSPDFLSLQKVYCSGQDDFYVDDSGNLYSVNNFWLNTLLVLDGNGSPLQSVKTERGAFSAICVSPDNVLYAVYTEETKLGVFPLDSALQGDLPLYECDLPAAPFRFLDSVTAMDKNGSVFSVQPHSRLFVKRAETAGDMDRACVLPDGNIVCGTDTDTATGFSDGTAVREYRFDGTLLDLACSGGRTAALVQNGGALQFVPLSQAQTTEIGGPESSSEPEPSSEEPSSSPVDDALIESAHYRIDRVDQRIYVDDRTTYSVLKSRVTVRDAALQAEKPNGSALTSGYLMTGAVLSAVTEDGLVRESLTVIVPGDLTGTGSVSASDMRLFYRWLNGSAELSEPAYAAADFDRDGDLTTADLLLLKKKIGISS